MERCHCKMYIIGIIVIVIYVVLWILSLSEEKKVECKWYFAPFNQIGNYLYKKLHILKKESIPSTRLKKDLEMLNLGKSKEMAYKAYCIQKLEFVMFLFLLGTIICIFIKWQGDSYNLVDRDRMLTRKESGNVSQEINLRVFAQDKPVEDITFSLESRIYTNQEIILLYQEFLLLLKTKVLDRNTSFSDIVYPLNLINVVKGYPFYVEWRVSDFNVIDSTGMVNYQYEELEKNHVILTAEITYENFEEIEEIEIWVAEKKLSEKESWHRDIITAITTIKNNTKDQPQMQLPTEIEGIEVEWRERKKDSSILYFIGICLVSIAIYFLQDKDLHTKSLERRKSILKVYPFIVNKFALYLGAGMTIRNAFQQITESYRKQKEDKILKNPIFQELVYSCNELQAGISEREVYEGFGKRIGLQEYTRLANILNQNLKKGNSAILIRLKEEGKVALNERVLSKRKEGEEAESKLLLPMIMMLFVVMVMIMMPAFSSF